VSTEFDNFLKRAPRSVAFLNKQTFFSEPHVGDSSHVLVIQDANKAIEYATEQDEAEFVDWTALGETTYAEASFDPPRWLRSRLFDYVSERLDSANLSGFDERVPFVRDNMVEDLMCCLENEASGQSVKLFDENLMAYEQGGWPCGWLGKYPEGKLIVLDPNPK
jgi:hypothetical protein